MQQARLYVFQDHRARVAGLDDPAATLPYGAAVWAGPAPDGVRATWAAYLTVVDLTFDSPASQIPGDLVIVDNGDDEPLQPAYEVTRPVTIARHPVRGRRDPRRRWPAVVVLVALGTLIARFIRRSLAGQ